MRMTTVDEPISRRSRHVTRAGARAMGSDASALAADCRKDGDADGRHGNDCPDPPAAREPAAVGPEDRWQGGENETREGQEAPAVANAEDEGGVADQPDQAEGVERVGPPVRVGDATDEDEA